jgi:hypothetical protein
MGVAEDALATLQVITRTEFRQCTIYSMRCPLPGETPVMGLENNKRKFNYPAIVLPEQVRLKSLDIYLYNEGNGV